MWCHDHHQSTQILMGPPLASPVICHCVQANECVQRSYLEVSSSMIDDYISIVPVSHQPSFHHHAFCVVINILTFQLPPTAGDELLPRSLSNQRFYRHIPGRATPSNRRHTGGQIESFVHGFCSHRSFFYYFYTIFIHVTMIFAIRCDYSHFIYIVFIHTLYVRLRFQLNRFLCILNLFRIPHRGGSILSHY